MPPAGAPNAQAQSTKQDYVNYNAYNAYAPPVLYFFLFYFFFLSFGVKFSQWREENYVT